MKESRYNYIITDEGKIIVFNGISEKFFEIKTSHWPFYKEIFANPDAYYDGYRKFMDCMLEDGFLIDHEDESPLIERKLQTLRRPEEYSLMYSNEINTTFMVLESGCYTIEIVTDSWSAIGNIDI